MLKTELINIYFRRGYQYRDIIELLKTQHNIIMSIHSLHRYLNKMSLFRKSQCPPSGYVLTVIKDYLKENGSSRVYRNVKQRLSERGHQFTFEIVRVALKEIDSEGVATTTTKQTSEEAEIYERRTKRCMAHRWE